MYKSFLRRRLAGAKLRILYSLEVTGNPAANSGNSCRCELYLDEVPLTQTGTYMLPAGTRLRMVVYIGSFGLPSNAKILVDGVQVASGNGASHTLVLDGNCRVVCSSSGSGYAVKASIQLSHV